MTFLSEPEPSPDVEARYAADRAAYGFVMDLSHLWAHQPEAHTRLFELLGVVGGELSFRERGVLTTAAAATIGDSYCSLAWGWKQSEAGNADAALGVLTGDDTALDEREAALAAWARLVARDPQATTPEDVQALRDAGWSDEEVFRVTVFVALRIAFSTVNAALGAQPDAEIVRRAPEVADVVTWGRPPA